MKDCTADFSRKINILDERDFPIKNSATMNAYENQEERDFTNNGETLTTRELPALGLWPEFHIPFHSILTAENQQGTDNRSENNDVSTLSISEEACEAWQAEKESYLDNSIDHDLKRKDYSVIIEENLLKRVTFKYI